MRKPTALVAVAVLFVLALFALWDDRPSAAQQAQPLVERWEYETVLLQTSDVESYGENQLDKLGKAGWELCGTVPGETQSFLILKRQLQ